MTHRQRRPNARPAFTMIELLVVITIIAILVALLSTAVMRSITKGAEVVTSSEIGEIQSKLSAVQRQFNLNYLPSRLHLSKRNNYGGSQLDLDSVAYLQARFGKNSCFGFKPLPLANPNFIDWNGNGNDKEELYLEGQQCLVFHLGGVPTVSTGNIAMTGFSNNPQNPALPAAAGDRRQGPYFEFQSNRLAPFTSPTFQNPVNFPVPAGFTYGAFPIYWDSYTRPGGNATRQPFAFFTSYNSEGGGLYDKYGASSGVVSDCPQLGLLPYQAGATTWLNPSSFQIISAGRDGKFGGGGTNWSRSGTTDPLGADDQSNFSAHLLGIAP